MGGALFTSLLLYLTAFADNIIESNQPLVCALRQRFAVMRHVQSGVEKRLAPLGSS
jgi:hypothetical protein